MKQKQMEARPSETPEQAAARAAKQLKAARSFAKRSGIDLRRVALERRANRFVKDEYLYD